VFYSENLPGSREETELESFAGMVSTVARMKKQWQVRQLKRTCTLGHRWDKAVTAQLASNLRKVSGISAASKDFLPSKHKHAPLLEEAEKWLLDLANPLAPRKLLDYIP